MFGYVMTRVLGEMCAFDGSKTEEIPTPTLEKDGNGRDSMSVGMDYGYGLLSFS